LLARERLPVGGGIGWLTAAVGSGRSWLLAALPENLYEAGVWLAHDGMVSAGAVATGGSGDQDAVELLYLCMEVAGCPTVCRHCWAQGVGYGAMPLADIAWALEGAHQFCESRGLAFDAYPMHELAAHPDAARVFGLFNAHSASARGGSMFEPWPTTGVPLAVRDDWREVLRAAADTGTVNVWVAFHGVGAVHDRQVNRRGAFAETCLAVERAHAAGLSVGGNVFITTASLPQLDELTATLRRLPVNAQVWHGTAAFLPTPRSRRNERLRPTLADLLPVATRIAELTAPIGRPWWASLETHTEAAYVRQALAGDWPAAPDGLAGELALVCRPNLDVHSGLAGHYRTRYGNLRADGIPAVLDRAIADGRRPDDALWFSLDPLPTPAKLAARHGDVTGLGVHPGPESARYLWLDRAQRQARNHGTMAR
jgi:hypothetical protein